VNFPNIRKRIDLVLEEDKFYYDGGPGRLRARIIYFAPKLGRSLTGSLKDAEKYLIEAIATHPNFTLSYLFLADIYWKMKKKDQCRAELMKVLEIPENSLPRYSPENRRDKIDAQKRLLEYFTETF
jgi:tetratricopeptide (TPR) repeat protein